MCWEQFSDTVFVIWLFVVIRLCTENSMFTWKLLSTDWTKSNVVALFERCQDSEWCAHDSRNNVLPACKRIQFITTTHERIHHTTAYTHKHTSTTQPTHSCTETQWSVILHWHQRIRSFAQHINTQMKTTHNWTVSF